MDQVIVYFTFNGNCREAMSFYQECLGGELELLTIGEINKNKMPEAINDFTLQAFLQKDNILLMGTDMIDEKLVKGNSVSILLESDDKEKIYQYYKNLVRNGFPTDPLDKNAEGELFGGLTDKFGNHWLFQHRGQNAF